MREVKTTRVDKNSEDYKRPGGRPSSERVSPLRGKKQRWGFVNFAGGSFFKTRRAAMELYKVLPRELQEADGLPIRVSV